MDKTSLQLLQIISSSLHNKKVNFENINSESINFVNDKYENQDVNWDEILYLSEIHKILPLVYESCFDSKLFKMSDENIQKKFKLSSKSIVFNQVQRSQRFLELYKGFNEANIDILVFKGIILRELYPIPDERVSGDEDLLIKVEDLTQVTEILKLNKMRHILDKSNNKSENEDEKNIEDVYHYFCEKTGLHLEIHTQLFGNDSDINKKMESAFSDVFDDFDTININNVKVHTFSIDKHFLYIICHAVKHFISCGSGIRQIADICMYINEYYKQINWQYIWEQIENLGYETLFVNILQICIDYLGLDEEKIYYTKPKENYYINTENLLEDIIDGGIYGFSYKERLNAANISLNAVNEGADSKSNIKSSMAAIFPNRAYLKDRYKYLNKYPFLLPIAWISRICTYIKEIGNIKDVRSISKETIAIGNRRIDLLKEYELISSKR